MTRLLTTTAVLLAICAVTPAQAKTSISGLSASTLTTNGMSVNGAGANGAAIENDGALVIALRKCANCRRAKAPKALIAIVSAPHHRWGADAFLLHVGRADFRRSSFRFVFIETNAALLRLFVMCV